MSLDQKGSDLPQLAAVDADDRIVTIDVSAGETKTVPVSALNARYATAAQGALADTATQPGDLATVATTGAYSDLSGTPTLGTLAAVDDAPSDGNQYARSNGAWAEVVASGGGDTGTVIDGGAADSTYGGTVAIDGGAAA